MDPLTTSQPFTLNRGDGSSLAFPLLSPSYRIRFRNAFRLDRKVKRVESLRFIGATPQEIRDDLKAFDAQRLSESDVEEWVFDPEGQRAAVLLSLAMAEPALLDAEDAERDGRFDALALDEAEALEVAAGVLKLRIVTAEPPAAGASKPNPTTAGTEATGGGEPTSSAAT